MPDVARPQPAPDTAGTARRPARRPASVGAWLRQALASLAFNAVMWTSVLIYAPLMLLTFPLSFEWRFYLISRWAAFHVWLARALCGLRYEIHGREHLPPGPAIIMSKHQSTWETLALPSLLPPQTFVLKRELMWVPLFGWALALIRPIAIDRGSRRQAIQQIIDQGRARLADGIWVTVFPEGTRVAPGQRRRWGLGGAVLAAETGHPVVPVAHDAGHYWPRRRFLKHPGTIRLVIGPAVDPSGRSAGEILRLSEDWVNRTVERLERGEI